MHVSPARASTSGSPEGHGGSPAHPDIIERWNRRLCLAAAAIAALSVLITLGATGYSVFMRYVAGRPITWIDELSGYLVVAIVMFGAAEALRRDDHIQVDLLTSAAKGGALAFLRVLWMAMVMAFTGVLLVSAWGTVTFSRDFGMYSEGYMEMPMWIPQSLLIVGSILMLLAAVAKISAAIRDISLTRDNRP